MKAVGQFSLRSLFVGKNGIRSGWRVLIFLALAAPLVVVTQQAAKLVPALKAAAMINMHGGPSVPLGDIVIQGSALLPMLIVAWIMSKIEKVPFGTYGLPNTGNLGKLFWQGAFWGLATEAVAMLLILVFHGFSFGAPALDLAGAAKYAALWAIAFWVVAMQEEFFYRGYILSTLSYGMGFWPAAILTSLLFAAIHLSNPGENWIGVAEILGWAMVVCLTIRRTGSLWFAVGFHAADDFAQTFLFSVNNSGNAAQGQLFRSSMHGPAWLTGGAVGPEGSIFSCLTIGIFAVVFNLLYRPDTPESAHIS